MDVGWTEISILSLCDEKKNGRGEKVKRGGDETLEEKKQKMRGKRKEKLAPVN